MSPTNLSSTAMSIARSSMRDHADMINIIHVRSCASIISNFYLTFYPDKRCMLSFAKQLRLWSFTKIECRDDLVQWLWNIHKGFAAERPHSQNDLKEQL